MIPSQQILKLAKDNNGVITTAMIANAGLPRRHTSRWAEFQHSHKREDLFY